MKTILIALSFLLFAIIVAFLCHVALGTGDVGTRVNNTIEAVKHLVSPEPEQPSTTDTTATEPTKQEVSVEPVKKNMAQQRIDDLDAQAEKRLIELQGE